MRDESKLPKWAQDELRTLRGSVRFHRDIADQLRRDFENRGSWDVRLGDDEIVGVLHLRNEGNGTLDMFGGDTLQIEPQASNHIKVRTEETAMRLDQIGTLSISVTNDDIREGVRSDPCKCAFARALRRTTRRWVSVGMWHCTVGSKYETHKRANLPENVQRFIEAFDAGAEVKPFTVELDFA